MSIINEDQLKKDISSARLAPAYILCGEDAYLKKLYYDRIAEKAVDGDPFFNLQDFNADCDLQSVYDAVSQYPVMSERKCVRLTDYDFEHCSSADFERLCAILGELYDSCVLILRFETVPFDAESKKAGKAKKVLAALEKGGGKAAVLGHRRPAELAKILCDGAEKRGCKMDAAVARYLTETVGNDLNILQNELEKLTNYIPGGVIDRETVDKVCIKTVEASVYDLTSHIFNCDVDGALQLLGELFYMRIEPMVILYTVFSAYTDIYRAFAASQDGVPLSAAAAAFDYGKRTFLLERASRRLRRFDAKKLSLSFTALLEADKSFKSFGADGRIILEKLTVRLCWIIAKGTAV